ncbi:MAG: hypothetical protein H7A23_03545 [Leptospiraceae bacterium]|nr:hypothetical protein [Leptospiraceae bacterium]MCP5493604.1 hypothetical protein [Leptospiraceae bacterium]
MVDPFQYFQHPIGLLRLNELLNHFPKFIPHKFSEFLLKKTENIILINYSFQKIYETLYGSPDTYNESKENFIFILNSLNLEILSKLVDINLPYLFEIYRKLHGIHVYFKFLDQENIYKLIEYFADLYNKSSQTEILYKFKLYHVIPFLNEKGIQRFLSDLNMEDFKQDFSSVFSRDELIFLVHYNQHIYEIITLTKGKDDELEYETNIGYADFSEIEQVLLWFQDEYQTELEKYNTGQIYDTNILKERNETTYLRLEYILSFIKDMPESKREIIIEELIKKKEYESMMAKIDLETLVNLHRNNFELLKHIKK